MVQYIYYVKCPGCPDESYEMFDAAKECAMSRLSQKPIITQTEFNSNSSGMGETVGSKDLGTIWSWEDMMTDVPTDNELTTFSKSETFDNTDFFNCEFDSLDEVPDNYCRPVYNKPTPHKCEVPVTEDLNFVDNWEYLDYGAKLTKEALYDLLVTRGRYVEIGIGDREHYDTRFSDGSRYSDSRLEITMNADGTFEAYEWDHSDDGDSTDGEFEFTSNSFDELWNELVDYAPEYFINEPNARKSVPSDMTLESLVEEMEENEDTVECKVCEELFEKAKCTEDPERGWVCEACSQTEQVTEAVSNKYPDELNRYVTFTYPKMTVSIVTGTIPATLEEPEDYYESDHTDIFDYEVHVDDVATVLYENFMDDADVTADPDPRFATGMSALEDDDLFLEFMINNFDRLFDKYYKQLLDYYEEAAEEAAREKWQQEYNDWEYYDESLDTSDKETLEESDAEFFDRLTMCPECGSERSFDRKACRCLECKNKI